MPTEKEETKAMGFKVSPPMACPRKENTKLSRNKMSLVINNEMAPSVPKYGY